LKELVGHIGSTGAFIAEISSKDARFRDSVVMGIYAWIAASEIDRR
jgi:hypothetical protein